MEPISPLDLLYAKKILTTLLLAFILFALTARIIGQERKERWFRKRKKYSFFTRRGVFGEFINFGYPCTREGILLSLLLIGAIFSFGYWYVLA